MVIIISPERSLTLNLKASHIEAEVNYQPPTSACTTEPTAQTNGMVFCVAPDTENVYKAPDRCVGRLKRGQVS